MKHCRGCSHPTICDTHGCGAEEARENKARRAEAEATAKNLKHCAIVVSDWLAGGCDVNDIPRPHIAVLVTWTKESLLSVLLNAADKPTTEARSAVVGRP